MNSKFFNYKIILLILIIILLVSTPFLLNKYKNYKKSIINKLSPNLSLDEQDCVTSKVSLDFLNKLSTVDPEVLAQDKSNAKEFDLLRDCILHKATQL